MDSILININYFSDINNYIFSCKSSKGISLIKITDTSSIYFISNLDTISISFTNCTKFINYDIIFLVYEARYHLITNFLCESSSTQTYNFRSVIDASPNDYIKPSDIPDSNMIPSITTPKFIPTTILTYFPDIIGTTIQTNIQNIVQTTIPNTISTIISSTITNNFPTIISTTFSTEIPTSVLTLIPNTISTTILTTIELAIPTTITNIFPATISTIVQTITIPTNIAINNHLEQIYKNAEEIIRNNNWNQSQELFIKENNIICQIKTTKTKNIYHQLKQKIYIIIYLIFILGIVKQYLKSIIKLIIL